ncbi:unnamed protein product [Linum trigynum]|uniref:Uncharacterized protein n=1 Tax=Linum trigynum TaxID=586398 RepID=A0AAV2ETD6_9ROSI
MTYAVRTPNGKSKGTLTIRVQVRREILRRGRFAEGNEARSDPAYDGQPAESRNWGWGVPGIPTAARLRRVWSAGGVETSQERRRKQREDGAGSRSRFSGQIVGG